MKLIKNFFFVSLFLLMNSELFHEEGYYLGHDNFKIIKKFNEKTYFSEYKVYNKDDDNLYIIRKINIKGKSPKEIETLKEEFEKLSNIDSEFIIKYYDYFIEDDTFNIVMEYIDEMNLKTFIELYNNSDVPIERVFILSFIYHISLGLQVIHENNIIHGEIEPENIFITNDYKIKIGGFGIINQTNFQNIEDKAQIDAPIYNAPEIIKGLNYDYKIDIWSFGCIIYELCTLKNYYFTKNKTINTVKYGEKFQNIIDLTLRKKPEKRPAAEEILQMLVDEKSEIFDLFKNFTMDKLIRSDPILEKYLLEKAMFNILDKEFLDMFRNSFSEYIKEFFDIIWTFLSNLINEIINYFKSFIRIEGKLSLISRNFLGFDKNKSNMDKFNKDIFIRENLKIVRIIISDLLVKIFTFMKKKMPKEKTINIYNIKTFEKKTNLIEREMASNKFIKKLKRKIIKKFNILLLGNTNVGKSTLINEFLKLSKKESAKESTGGPTKTKDFKQYNGSYKDVVYSLFDTNGITNKGENSIEKKIKNTEKEIIKRDKSNDPNQLIHCIWYCFQGTNIQPSDGEFIKKLFNIYDKYSIPIIFVHTQTYSIGQSKICKKGIKKYLKEIFVKEEDVHIHLKNYVNILARGDNKIGDDDEEEDNINIEDCLNNDNKPFGLDELEKISRREIKEKGIKSSYYEFIKEEIKPSIINAAFRMFFTKNNLNVLAKTAINEIKNYTNIILELFDDEQLNLSKMIKERNKKILNNLYESFQKIKENIKDNFVDYLTVENLKKNYDKNIEKLFDFKSENYKKSMDYQTFCEKIEKIIYNKLNKNSKKILDILVNLSFNNYIIENIKLGIEEHFSDREEKIINKIYEDIFESLDFNNASK